MKGKQGFVVTDEFVTDSAVEWHLDVLHNRDGVPCLIVFDPASGHLDAEKMALPIDTDVERALRSLFARAPEQPTEIVTDCGRYWNRLNDQLVARGMSWRRLTFPEQRRVERLIRDALVEGEAA